MVNESPVFRSLEIIESRISEKLTVENIAKSVYFSKYHYQRLFREIVGDSVMEYVTKRKLTLAGKELLETNANILDIALKFGFDSHEGFTRSFKAYMGVTPTDYRKYSLSAIKQMVMPSTNQKTVKGRSVMLYSKTTDEIIRELNDFIAKAKEAANCARKGSGLPEYTAFWQKIADTTDFYADGAEKALQHVTAIVEHPDEISNQFAIIKVIEDIAFQSNLLAFNIGLMISRDTPERAQRQTPLHDKYLELAKAATLKAGKVAQFFNELSGLILEGMKKTAAGLIQTVLQKGHAAADRIKGYDNIKNEVNHLMKRIESIPLEEITVSILENHLFALHILSFAAELEITRSPQDKELFEGMAVFEKSLFEAVEFFRTIIKPEGVATLESSVTKHLEDIAYQGNILLFYTRGEISHEKLGHLLDHGQKAEFDKICDKINSYIQFTHKSVDETAFKEIANRLYEIKSDMGKEADKLNELGGAVRFLASEFGELADRVACCING